MNEKLNTLKFGFDILIYLLGIVAIVYLVVREIVTRECFEWAKDRTLNKLIVLFVYIFYGVVLILGIPNCYLIEKSYLSDIPHLFKGEFQYTEGYPQDIYEEGGKFSDDIIDINGMEIKAAGGIPRIYKTDYKFEIYYLPNTKKAIKIRVIKINVKEADKAK